MNDLFRGRATRPIATIGIGAVAGQLVAVAIAPILTRIYPPEAFGVFTYVVALVIVLTPICNLRLDQAIPVPEADDDANLLLRIGATAVILMSVVVGLAIWAFGPRLDDANDLELLPLLWFMPIMLALAGWYGLLSQMLIRHSDYRSITIRSLTQSICTAVGQLIFGLTTGAAGGLFLGAVIGRAASLIAMFSRGRVPVPVFVRQPLRGGFGLLREFKSFPLLFAPAGMLNQLGTQLPIILVGAWFGALDAGYLGVTLLVVIVPEAVITTAVAQVFLGEIAKRTRSKDQRVMPIFLRAARYGALGGATIFLGCTFLAPWLFPVVLGQEWQQSGEFAQAIALSAGLSFLIQPLSTVFAVYQRGRLNLGLDVLRVVLVGGFGLIAHAVGLDVTPTIWVIYAGLSLTYLVTLVAAYRTVKAGTLASAIGPGS